MVDKQIRYFTLSEGNEGTPERAAWAKFEELVQSSPGCKGEVVANNIDSLQFVLPEEQTAVLAKGLLSSRTAHGNSYCFSRPRYRKAFFPPVHSWITIAFHCSLDQLKELTDDQRVRALIFVAHDQDEAKTFSQQFPDAVQLPF